MALATAFVLAQPGTTRATKLPPREGTPAALVQAHHCWTGQARAGAEARHVVVAKAGATGPVYSSRLVGDALDQVLAGVDHGLRVYAFCR